MDAAAWAEQHLKHADSGDPFRLEPFQRRMVEALQSGEPLRMVTPAEVAARERRAAKIAAGRLREGREAS